MFLAQGTITLAMQSSAALIHWQTLDVQIQTVLTTSAQECQHKLIAYYAWKILTRQNIASSPHSLQYNQNVSNPLNAHMFSMFVVIMFVPWMAALLTILQHVQDDGRHADATRWLTVWHCSFPTH